MKSFCIIGLGKFGMTLAETLANEGKQVMIIDVDPDKINLLADKVTHAVIGDPTNETVLRQAGVKDYDCAAVCMTGNVNTNVLLTIMLKELGIKNVISRAANEGHKKVLERIGTDMIIVPEQDMGIKLGNMLSRSSATNSNAWGSHNNVNQLFSVSHRLSFFRRNRSRMPFVLRVHS